MQDITLQDIITKKLNTLVDAPDDLICDAYYQAQEADDRQSRIKAFIATQVAIKANKKLGIQIPNLEHEAVRVRKDLDMSDEEIANYYMEHLDK